MNENKNRRTYGPLAPIHLRMLQDPLDAINSKYQIYTDEDLIAKAQIRPKGSVEASPFLHNTSPVNLKEYLFIDIPLVDVMAVRHLLVKLGFEQTIDAVTGDSLNADEFICPACNFVQSLPGYCPKHHHMLIPYFDIRRKEFRFKNYVIRFVAISSLVAALIIIYFSLRPHLL